MAKERIAMIDDDDDIAAARAAAEDLLTEDEAEGVGIADEDRKARAAEAADPAVDEAVAAAASDEDDEDAPAPAADAPPPAAEPPLAAAPEAVVFTDEEKTRLGALDAEVDKIADDYDNGDITRDEMKAKLKEIETERAGLVSKQARAEESERAALDYEVQAWRADVKTWQKDHPEIAALFAEGATAEQKAAGALFNDLVKKTAATDLADDISNHQLLDQALYAARIRAPKMFPAKAAKPASEKPLAVADPATRPEKPPALSRMPAADNSAADTSRFAALDKLEGEKLEEAMASLRRTNPAQYEAFMAR